MHHYQAVVLIQQVQEIRHQVMQQNREKDTSSESVMNNDYAEEIVAPTHFYSQTNIFNNTTTLIHQSRIVQKKDSISDINQIEIADGLKHSLMKLGFDLGTLLNTTSERIPEILGIELYVAKLIRIAVTKEYRKTS
jgi:hypothetical protein